MAAWPVIARFLLGFAETGRARRWLGLLMLCTLASCGGQRLSSGGSYPHYASPGSASDPWGPFIREASSRYGVPERWTREVMRQESGGRQYLRGQPITSDAGAAGLMQLMPATYAELRGRYGLGDDPYDPHDNIMAGTAYIGELYKLYGSPAFLAAYNAGPHRLEAYMAGGSALPNQTVDYLASIAPRLGNDRPMTGPLAAYADGGQAIEVAQAEPVQSAPDIPAPEPPAPVFRPPSAYVPHDFVRPPRPGCWQDPNAAYDPDAPCQAPPSVSPPAPQPQRLAEAEPDHSSSGGTVPGATLWGRGAAAPPPQRMAQPADTPPPYTAPAYAPPAYPAPAYPAPAYAPPAYAPSAQAPASRYAAMSPPAAPLRLPEPRSPSHRFAFMPSASAATIRPALATGGWAVQVGAFANPAQARSVAENARTRAPRELQSAQTVLGTTTPFGGQVLYRARLLGLSAGTASAACGELAAQAMACVTVPPGG